MLFRSESSKNSSILSYLPIFPERTTWQIQGNIVPDSPEKELPKSRNQSTPLPTFQLTDTEKSELSQNFAVLPPLQAHGSFISSNLQSLDQLVRRELQGHMSQKVSTLQKQVVPLPVKKSWKTLNHLMDVQGVPEQEIPPHSVTYTHPSEHQAKYQQIFRCSIDSSTCEHRGQF